MHGESKLIINHPNILYNATGTAENESMGRVKHRLLAQMVVKQHCGEINKAIHISGAMTIEESGRYLFTSSFWSQVAPCGKEPKGAEEEDDEDELE